MATHSDEYDCVWLNVFGFLNSHDVGQCTLMSKLLRDSAISHFRQVPTTVHVVQTISVHWRKTDVKNNYDGIQGEGGLVYLSREKPFSHLYRMIASALDLQDEESHAVDIIYHGLLVGRPSECNSPTFLRAPEGSNEPPHIDVKINFAYLEWKYVSRQIPIAKWIWELRNTREAQLFAEGDLEKAPLTMTSQLGETDIGSATTHHWHHHLWDHSAQEWLPQKNPPQYTNLDSHQMQVYLELRLLEVNLRSTISQQYGDPTYLTANCGPNQSNFLPRLDPDMPTRPAFRWTTLYDFNGQVTYPGANAGAEYRRISLDERWYFKRPRWEVPRGHFDFFERYDRWHDLPFPSLKTA
jgi:hypothetical protein